MAFIARRPSYRADTLADPRVSRGARNIRRREVDHHLRQIDVSDPAALELDVDIDTRATLKHPDR